MNTLPLKESECCGTTVMAFCPSNIRYCPMCGVKLGHISAEECAKALRHLASLGLGDRKALNLETADKELPIEMGKWDPITAFKR